MNKVILLSRVSTESQDLEQQTNELLAEARRQGYADNNIIIIEDKESAIKLDEEHRHGLTELKQYINTDNTINCVICFEISRISRRQTVLYSIRDFLIEHNVQLICIKPYFRLLEDGKMSQTANIVFSMFSALAESEMTIKKSRMLRGKKAAQKQNRYIGGYILYGYKLDDDKKIVIDENKLESVHFIFDSYEQGKSCKWIAKELMSRGDLDSVSLPAAVVKIQNIIHNKGYIGQSSTYQYQRIISDEQFETCQQKIKDFHRNTKTNVSKIYLGKNIFRSDEGFSFQPRKSRNDYQSYNIYTGKTMNLGMQMIDELLWMITVEYKNKFENNDEILEENQKVGQILIKKALTCDNEIEKMKSKFDRIEERYIDGHISKEKADQLETTLKGKLKAKEDEKTMYMERLRVIRDYAHKVTNEEQTDLNDITDLSRRYDIVHEAIKSILVHHISKGEYVLNVTFANGYSYSLNIKRVPFHYSVTRNGETLLSK